MHIVTTSIYIYILKIQYPIHILCMYDSIHLYINIFSSIMLMNNLQRQFLKTEKFKQWRTNSSKILLNYWVIPINFLRIWKHELHAFIFFIIKYIFLKHTLIYPKAKLEKKLQVTIKRLNLRKSDPVHILRW